MAKKILASQQKNNDTIINQPNNKKTVIILLSIAIILIIGFGITALLILKNNTSKNTEKQALVLDASAQNTDKGSPIDDIILAGYDDISLAEKGTISLQNPAANQKDNVYIKYEIINNETNETIFETDLIEAGKEIIWTPSEQLEKGTYDVALIQHPFYIENEEFIPTMTVGKNNITLTIQ